MIRFFALCTALLTTAVLQAAIIWENNLPAALAMYSRSGVDGTPVIEDNAMAFATKKGLAVFYRKNVDFTADHDSFELQVKVPAGSRSINIYFTTDSEPQFAENKKRTVYYKATGDWQTIKFECSNIKSWKGKITGLRFDFHAPAGEKIYFRSAKITSKFDLPKAWNFAAPNAKAWNWRNSLAAPAVIVNGAMKLDFTGKYSFSSAIPVYLEAAKYPSAVIRLRVSKPGNYGVVIYFKTEADNKLSEKQKITFRFNATSEFQEIRIPLYRYAAWKGNITGFRLDISSPQVPCSMEITDFIFEEKENLAGLQNSGKSIGPLYDLTPDAGYFLSFNSSVSGKGKIQIFNPFGNIISEVPLSFPSGKTQTSFRIPGNGASIFFVFDSEIRDLNIRQIPAAKPNSWTAFWIADDLNFKRKSHQYFQKEVILDDEPVDCRFQGTADDRFDLYINGKKVVLQEMIWQHPRTADVTSFFKKGKNLIAFHLENNGEASGLLTNFLLVTASGSVTKVDSDKTFRTLRNPGNDWKDRLYGEHESFAPKVIGSYIVPPWGNWCLMPYEDFILRNQFAADNIKLTPIKGGVNLKCDLRAVKVFSPQNKISVRAIAGNIVVAEEMIIFPKTLNNGEKISIDQNIFSNKLLCDTYTLQLSGYDTNTLTGKELTFTVSEAPDMRTNIKSEVRQTINGPVIFIDGNAFNEMIFTSRIIDRMREHYDAGYRFFMVGVGTNVGKGLTTPGWNENGYDFTFITRKLNQVTAAFPEIRFILTFGIDAPYWWHNRYPDQSIYLEGKNNHEYLASPASKQWKKDGADFIRAFIRHVENSPLRHHVVGYRLSAMCDGGEWQYPGVWANPQLHADFSMAMQEYFREFLQKKYGKNFDVSNIKVPTGAERRLPSDTYFRDPAKEQLVIDYIECQSDAVASAAIWFLSVAKEEAKGKIVGIYGGYLLFYSGYPVQNIGHLAFRKVYLSGKADFFSGPIDYHLRKLGLPGGNMPAIGSIKLHGATYFQENDTRTFLNASPSHRHVDNLYESASVLLRESAIGLVTSTPIYTCDLTGNSYRNQGLIDTGKVLNDLFRENFNPAKVRKPEAALLYSIDSLPYLVEKNSAVTNASSYLLRINTGKSGAQCDTYLLEDILEDNFPAGQYKCFVIVNGFYLKPEIRQAIEKKLCKNGATVVFTPGAGIIKDKKLSPESMKEVTGFDFVKVDAKIPFKPAELTDSKAYVEKRYSDHRKVYLSSTELTPELYREIFASSGLHIWIKSNDTVTANGAVCFIHAASAGEKEIFLPEPAKVKDLITGEMIPTGNGGKSFKIKLRLHETRLYKFEKI